MNESGQTVTLPRDRSKWLTKIRQHVLPTLHGDTRVMHKSGETWSARKVLRRTLWHERDHTQHIAALLNAIL